jgi:hypothetical protein
MPKKILSDRYCCHSHESILCSRLKVLVDRVLCQILQITTVTYSRKIQAQLFHNGEHARREYSVYLVMVVIYDRKFGLSYDHKLQL